MDATCCVTYVQLISVLLPRLSNFLAVFMLLWFHLIFHILNYQLEIQSLVFKGSFSFKTNGKCIENIQKEFFPLTEQIFNPNKSYLQKAS